MKSDAKSALEHHLGMTCDPVTGYVQVPCDRGFPAALELLDRIDGVQPLYPPLIVSAHTDAKVPFEAATIV